MKVVRPSFIAIMPSRISGMGAFCAPGHSILAGMTLGRYEGRIMTRQELEARYAVHEPYDVLKVADDLFIDGSEGGNWIRFVNSPWSTANTANTKFVGAELVALRNIQQGEELLVDYGGAYPFDY